MAVFHLFKVLAEKVHMRALSIAQRVLLLQQGLSDRSGKIHIFVNIGEMRLEFNKTIISINKLKHFGVKDVGVLKAFLSNVCDLGRGRLF